MSRIIFKVANLCMFQLFTLFLLSACNILEKPMTVDVADIVEYNGPQISPQNDNKDIIFGFDLRLQPKEDAKIYIALLQYLEKQTGYKFKLRFSLRYEDTATSLGKGKIQLAAMGSVSCLLAMQDYDVKPLLAGLGTDNQSNYRAVIFTAADSPINNIKDLKGKIFAFGDKYSTQGHLIPRKMLENHGLGLDDIDYMFTGSHDASVKNVLNGTAVAGGIQDTLAMRLADAGIIKIIAVSEEYQRSLICYNNELDAKTVLAIKNALLKLIPHEQDGFHGWNKSEMPNGFTNVDMESLNKIKQLMINYGLL